MPSQIRPLALLTLAALPWLLGLTTELQDVDSAQYADVAKHVAQSGRWLALSDSTGPFVNKPPLAIWAQAAAIGVLGPTAVAARLPSLLFALAAIAAVFGLGRALFDRDRAWTAACFFASSVALQQMVLDPKVDLALTATATAALWAFVEARTRPRLVWLGWVFAGLAVLSKGPLGLALPAAALGPIALREGLRSHLKTLKPVRGLAIAAAIAAPYYVAVFQQSGSEGAGFVLWQQNVGRLFGQSGYADSTTPLFFFHTALWVFLPFTPLLILAIVQRRWKTQPLLWWALGVPFAVFSLSNYKLPQYLFCLAPAAALIAADALAALGEAGQRRVRVGMAALAAIGTAAAAWLLVDCFPPPSVLALGLALAAPLGAWFLGRDAAAMTAGALAGLHLVIAGWIFPAAASFQVGRALAERARAEDPGAELLPFIDAPITYAVSYHSPGFAARVGVNHLREIVDHKRASVVVVEAGAWPDFASAGLVPTPIAKFPAYPTSRPRLPFLRAETRPSQLQWRELVRVTVAP